MQHTDANMQMGKDSMMNCPMMKDMQDTKGTKHEGHGAQIDGSKKQIEMAVQYHKPSQQCSNEQLLWKHCGCVQHTCQPAVVAVGTVLCREGDHVDVRLIVAQPKDL